MFLGSEDELDWRQRKYLSILHNVQILMMFRIGSSCLISSPNQKAHVVLLYSENLTPASNGLILEICPLREGD